MAAAAAVFAAVVIVVVRQLTAVAVPAADVQAAAVTAVPPAGLEWRLRLSTQAARLELSCARLRLLARRFRGARGLLVAEGSQEKSKRILKTTLHQPRAEIHAKYCCSRAAVAGSREGVAVASDPWQVVIPCTGGGVVPNISTPPQRGGGGGGASRRRGLAQPVCSRAGFTLDFLIFLNF